VSNNQLTGPLIVINTTTYFAASTNCFQGSLPPELCQSRKSEVIILNGLSSSTNCQIPIFPNTIIDTFTTKFTIYNGLLDCLFQLPKLQILQLSGNGLTGKIPAITNQTGSLYNLDLSHNALIGTIPQSIQVKSSWESLDLSYNLLTGELSNDFASFSLSSRNQSLTLTVNRLSGNIPSSLLSANDIDILDGNMFTCNYDSNLLPSQDPHADNYSCGSDLVNLSIYFWLCTGGVLVLFVILLGCLMFFTAARESVKSILSSLKLLISWYNYFHNYCENEYQKETNRPSSAVLKTDQNQILLLRFFNQRIRRTSLFLTVVILVVLLPTYGVLSLDYSTYQIRYAWAVSGLFLSGEESAIALFVELFFFILFTTLVICYFWVVQPLQVSSESTTVTLEQTENSKCTRIRELFKLLLVMAFNLVIMMSADVVYVLIVINYNTTIIILAELALALIKIFWNNYFLWSAMKMISNCLHQGKKVNLGKTSEEFDVSFIYFNIGLNNLIYPIAAIMIISSNCFYNAFFPASTVTTTFSTNISPATTPVTQVNVATSYSPPFIYGYQCSSVIYSYYCPVFIFMLVFETFVFPVVSLLFRLLKKGRNVAKQQFKEGPEEEEDGDSRKISKIELVAESFSSLNRSLPNQTPAESSLTGESPSSSHSLFQSIFNFMDETIGLRRKFRIGKMLFDKNRYVIRMNSYLLILVAYGAVFPPLAIIVTVAIYLRTGYEEVLIGGFLITKDLQAELQ
jgi:hypothetical protein